MSMIFSSLIMQSRNFDNKNKKLTYGMYEYPNILTAYAAKLIKKIFVLPNFSVIGSAQNNIGIPTRHPTVKVKPENSFND